MKYSKTILPLAFGFIIGFWGDDVWRWSQTLLDSAKSSASSSTQSESVNIDQVASAPASKAESFSENASKSAKAASTNSATSITTPDLPGLNLLSDSEKRLAQKLLPKPLAPVDLTPEQLQKHISQSKQQRQQIKSLMSQYQAMSSNAPERAQVKQALQQKLQEYSQTFLPVAQQRLYEANTNG